MQSSSNISQRVKKLEKSLKRQQRKLSRQYKSKKNGGGDCYKNVQKQMFHVQKLHVRLANIRREYVRDVVHALVKAKPKYITMEDLNVKGMMKNRHLSDSVRKQNFYRLKEWLRCQCKKHGMELRMVHRFYPSSKTCSCGGRGVIFGNNFEYTVNKVICDCGNDEFNMVFSIDAHPTYTKNYECSECGNLIGTQVYD
ncbi:RNA-guided endonuclease TnpB family protein [Bacillus songklensis]|uniref:RNA-guided endonuclease TnpB family protein n=1 Tax=Bacillus songklensis TaxID=1069116 RepID=A0ABV8B6L4_9BACI